MKGISIMDANTGIKLENQLKAIAKHLGKIAESLEVIAKKNK